MSEKGCVAMQGAFHWSKVQFKRLPPQEDWFLLVGPHLSSLLVSVPLSQNAPWGLVFLQPSSTEPFCPTCEGDEDKDWFICISSFWQNDWQIIYIDKYLNKWKLFKSMKDAILDIFVLDVSHNHCALFWIYFGKLNFYKFVEINSKAQRLTV